MKQLSTGIDIVEIEELKVLINKFGNRILKRLFTAEEIAYCIVKPNQFQHFAARMAAKEAVFKAIGHGWGQGVQWKNIEVTNNSLGAPALSLSGNAEKIFTESGFLKHNLTITHSKQYAIAIVNIYS